jgi:hypothetical protein
VPSFWDFLQNLNATGNYGQPWGAGANPPSASPVGGSSGGPLAPSGFLRSMRTGQATPSGNLVPDFDPYGLSRTGFDPTGFHTPASPGQPVSESPGWLASLLAMTKPPEGGGQGAPQMAPAVRPPTAAQPLPPSQAGSHQGFLTGSSRGGFDLGDLMKVAAIVGTMGAGAGVAGAMGGGGAMGAGGAAGGGAAMGGGGGGGGGFLSGIMGGGGGGGGGLGGMLGGGGGGKQSDVGPPMAYAPLPAQTGPLVPQNNPWSYWG